MTTLLNGATTDDLLDGEGIRTIKTMSYSFSTSRPLLTVREGQERRNHNLR